MFHIRVGLPAVICWTYWRRCRLCTGIGLSVGAECGADNLRTTPRTWRGG